MVRKTLGAKETCTFEEFQPRLHEESEFKTKAGRGTALPHPWDLPTPGATPLTFFICNTATFKQP